MMDGSNFDNLAKRLAATTSRKEALRLLGGTLAAGALGALLPGRAWATGGGNSACAHFCASVFGADTPAAAQCTSDAAHNKGLCYTACGPSGAGGTLCGDRSSYTSTHCCATGTSTCLSGACCATANVCGSTCLSAPCDASLCQTCDPSSGTCVSCASGYLCRDGGCVANVAGGACQGGGDCTSLECTNGTCQPHCVGGTCAASSACAANEACISGVCQPVCGGDADCTNGNCVNGHCAPVAGGQPCVCGGDCLSMGCNGGNSTSNNPVYGVCYS